MSIAPARRCAFRVVRRVFEEGAFADRALHSEAGRQSDAGALDPRDRALATALVYGTVQRRRTLDHVLGQLVSRPLEQLDPPVLAALRLGAYQLLMMDGISPYAAVNDSVELAKRESPGGAKFVNAVLRRVIREGAPLLAALDDRTAARAATLHSVPDWLAELWWRELGAAEARALLATINTPAETSLRVNPLRGRSRADVLEALPDGSRPGLAPAFAERLALPELPEGLVLSGPFDAFGSQLWCDGQIMPQSRGSMVVSRVLDPRPGERVLDLCAAPGGKTTHLAALMDGEGEIVAVEVHPGRARALAETCAQMGARNVRVQQLDGRDVDSTLGSFDRILVDPPCSGLGTLQSRPDLRWHGRRGEFERLAGRQLELLAAGAARLSASGTLVYSVCTISHREGPELVDRFLAEHPEFASEGSWQLLPHRDHTDGFFIARLSRRSD